MNSQRSPWAVVIFACRTTLPLLLKTLNAALIWVGSCAVTHVLVNGPKRRTRSSAEVTLSIDGYVRLKADAVDLLGRAVIGNTFAMGWNRRTHRGTFSNKCSNVRQLASYQLAGCWQTQGTRVTRLRLFAFNQSA
jgi:hypothetical protein